MRTTNYFKIYDNAMYGNLVYGGQGSGKTYAICQWLVNYATWNAGADIQVIAHELAELRKRAMKDSKLIASVCGDFVNIQDKKILFRNGSIIEFRGISEEGDGNSVRADICYFNEVDELPAFDWFNNFAKRCKVAWFADFNPRSEFFVENIREFFRGRLAEIVCLYSGNEFLPENEKLAIEKIIELGKDAPIGSYNRYMYEVYVLGVFSALGGGVFQNVYSIDAGDYEDIDAPEFIGIDFGDNSDPNAVCGVKYKDNNMYIRQYVYASLLADSTLSEMINPIVRPNQNVVYETATAGHTRVRNILQNPEIKVKRLKFIPVVKEKVEPSVMEMCKYKAIYVCGSESLAEFQNYKIINGELKGTKGDHIIDSARYVNIMKKSFR